MRLNGLPGLSVEAVGAVADHRDDGVTGLTGQQDVHHAGDPGEVRRGVGVHRLLGVGLNIGVQRGLDHVTALGDLLLAQSCPGQVLLHVVAEERPVAGGDTTAWQFIGPGQDAQWLLFGGAQFVSFVRQLLDHGVQHQVSPGQRAIRIDIGVQRARRLHHAGQ